MHDKRDWLILSLKWTKDHVMVWYATGCAGYTSNLLLAGRYTETEALAEEVPGLTLAVHLDDILPSTAAWVTLPNDGRVLNRLKAVSAKRRQDRAASVVAP